MLELQQHYIQTVLNFLETKKFFYISLVLFILQGIFIAYSSSYGIAPDEVYHIAFIKFYANQSFDPIISVQNDNFILGDVTRAHSYLYHYVLSLPHRMLDLLNLSEFKILVALRLINIIFSTLSLYALLRLGRKLDVSPVATNLSIFMLANTLMFVFLSASVNYDNLIVLFALTSVYLMVSLVQKFTARNLWLIAIIWCLGILVKQAFLPIVLMELALVLYAQRKNFKDKVFVSSQYFNNVKKPQTLLITVLLLTSLFLFGERYGFNLLRYQSIAPKCDLIHTVEQCRMNGIYRRAEILKAAKGGDDIKILEFSLRWSEAMKRKVFGIMGHKTIPDAGAIKYGAWAILGLMVVAGIRKFNYKDKPTNFLLVISVAYIILLLVINYRTYLRTGLYGLALQGRYAFPVLPAIYLIGNKYVFDLLKKNYQKAVYAVMVILIFITAGLPLYIYGTDPGWHNDSMKPINEAIKPYLEPIY